MQTFRLSRDAAVHLPFEQVDEFGTTLPFPLFHRPGAREEVGQVIPGNTFLVIEEPFQRIEGQFDREVIDIQPAGIVLGSEAVVEEAEPGAHPQFGLRLERSLHAREPFAVETVTEPADRIGNIPLHGLRPYIQQHPEPAFGNVRIGNRRDIPGGVGMRERFVAVRQDRQPRRRLGTSLGGVRAHDIFQYGPFIRIRDAKARVIVPHHDEPRLFTLLLQRRIRAERQPGRHGEPLSRELLRKQVRAVPQTLVRPFLFHRIQPYAPLRQRRMPIRRRNGRILPFEADAVGTVRGLVISSGGGAGVEKSIRPHWLPDPVPVGVLPDQRPAVGPPGHRLQMDDTPVGALVLEMEEPVLSGRSIDPGALVRAVDRTRSPGHHDPFLIRAEGMVGPEDRLPARGHAARRREDVILSAALVELGPLDGGLRQVAVIDDARRSQQTGAVRCHRRDEQDTLDSRPGPGTTM